MILDIGITMLDEKVLKNLIFESNSLVHNLFKNKKTVKQKSLTQIKKKEKK